MAITVVSTTPASGVTGHYIDHSVFVQFSQELESGYLSSDYFKIYRVNASHTSFYELVAVSVTKEVAVVEIDPTGNLRPNEHYALIVVGGASGIQSVGADTMTSNYVMYLETAATVSPTTDAPDIVPDVDLYIDGDHRDDDYEPSTDVFSTTGETASISLLSSFPQNKSVGVTSLENLVLLYNDDVDPDISIPINMLSGRYSNLPMDLDPFGDRDVSVTGVVSYDNQVVFELSGVVDTENTEYIFTTTPGVIRGVDREAYDTRTHEIRMMGALSPVYATPDQISARISGWDAEIGSNITDYDLWKLILEASIWVRDVFGTEMTEANMIQVNKLTLCLVLRDMFLRGFIFSGGIKARTLLATRVDYNTPDWDNIIGEIEKCITDSLPDGVLPPGGAGSNVDIGIKSGTALNSTAGFNTKRYGVYR